MLSEQMIISVPAQNTSDYSEILSAYGLSYQEAGWYWQVGKVAPVHGWMLHLSVIKTQLAALLHTILPELIAAQVPFKVVQRKDVAHDLQNGSIGYLELGKTVAIYPESPAAALQLATRLIAITQAFRGPAVPTDAKLGGIVYACYGGFNPVLLTDVNGQVEKYVYDQQGQPVKEYYPIPFALPAVISWPFASLADHKGPAYKRLLHKTFLPGKVLKSDAKGQVFKGWHIKSLFNISPCILKQGKRDMWADESERDICDRLRWQHQLHTELAGIVPLPKALGLFEEHEDTYLALEFIDGGSLYERITTIYGDGNRWSYLPKSSRLQLLDYLQRILEIVKTLHAHGYVHRDLSVDNFMADKQGQLFLIDNELMYNLRSGTPNPPFEQGSPGFMSPEQIVAATPTIQEDIYAIGGLMTVFFTGLSPVKFGVQDRAKLQEDLYFITGQQEIARLIAQCFEPAPEQRPALAAIQMTLTECRDQLQQAPAAKASTPIAETDHAQLQTLVSAALQSLSRPPMLMAGELWLSTNTQTEKYIQNEQATYWLHGGFYAGMSGTAYVIARAHSAGYAVDENQGSYGQAWEFIHNNYLQLLPDVIPGLYEGAAGMALGLAMGLQCGLLVPHPQHLAIIQECLQVPAAALHIANGAAGQGLALMQCTGVDASWKQALLQQQVQLLIQQQQKDGSWIRTDARGKGNKKSLGFGRGVAGISYFLLSYAGVFEDAAALRSAKRGLEWLRKQTRKKEALYQWHTPDGKAFTNPWLDNGFSGITLAFIKAYEVFKDPLYQQIAEGTLATLRAFLTDNNFTQAKGISGVGEVYLEAYQVFGTELWKQRADWIAQLLLHSSQQEESGACYWAADLGLPTASFMTGNSGIIHFLLRYLHPEKFSHPFFPAKINPVC